MRSTPCLLGDEPQRVMVELMLAVLELSKPIMSPVLVAAFRQAFDPGTRNIH
jgi:hypothetical protein